MGSPEIFQRFGSSPDIYGKGWSSLDHERSGTTGWTALPKTTVSSVVLNEPIPKTKGMFMRDADYYKNHLPVSEVLDRYEDGWFVMGTLTHKHRTGPLVQLGRFRSLMDTLGGVNRCYGKRLHWFVRVEGDGDLKNHHLHFILGGERVSNGLYKPMGREETCRFLERNWDYGMSEVVPFSSYEDGVGYVTKIESEGERDCLYELSHGLRKFLTREVV